MLKAIIIDDEVRAQRVLKNLIDETPQMHHLYK